MRRQNYYENLAADFSRPGNVTAERLQELIADYERFMSQRQEVFPPLASADLPRIEAENREWWPARCAVIRTRHFDLMGQENAEDFTYLCQDGPFTAHDDRGQVVGNNWGAILCQAGTTLIWPVVQFHGEVAFFEWATLDDATFETIAAGNVTFLRRGHAGGCYVKTEHLSFYRDVSASPELLSPS